MSLVNYSDSEGEESNDDNLTESMKNTNNEKEVEVEVKVEVKKIILPSAEDLFHTVGTKFLNSTKNKNNKRIEFSLTV